MTLEGGKISGSQLTFLMTGFIIGSSLILIPGQAAGHDAWLAILGGLVESLAFVFIYTALSMRFPGKTLIQFNDIIYGPYLGKLISGTYLWYFFHLASLVLRNFGDFFTTAIFPETPIIVFIVLITIICASAVRNGIEVISRCSILLVFIMIMAVLTTVFLLLKEIELTNFLPVFDIPVQDFLIAVHASATFPFGETVAFLMVIAFLNDGKEARKFTMLALIIAGLLLVMASMRNIGVLGLTSPLHTYPSFQAVRLTNIAEILTRLEIIVLGNLLAMGFLKISVLYYGTVLGTAQLLNLRSYLPLVLPIGALLVNFSILQFESVVENIFFAFEIYPYYVIPFQIGLPLLSLIIAIVRGLPKD